MDAEKLPTCLLDVIKSACDSERKLTWKIQENGRGLLVQLVWRSPPVASDLSVKMVSNKNFQKKKSPSKAEKRCVEVEKISE